MLLTTSICGFFLACGASATGISNCWPVARMVEVERKNRERLKQKHDEERDEAQQQVMQSSRGERLLQVVKEVTTSTSLQQQPSSQIHRGRDKRWRGSRQKAKVGGGAKTSGAQMKDEQTARTPSVSVACRHEQWAMYLH